MANNTVKFYPYERKGLSKYITENSGSRAQINVSVNMKGTRVSDGQDEYFTSAPKTIELQAPGDILAVNPASIKFASPPASSSITLSYEYMPFIEFFEADFPWRYTAKKPEAGKLTPWLALIICKEEEFSLRTEETGRKILKIMSAAVADVLQPVFQSLDSLAHVQVIESADDEISLSRILCNRQLQAGTTYTAFLIPTFKQGQENGISGRWSSNAPATQLAWECGMTGDMEFPVYHSWTFTTGGDKFLTLAELLRPISSADYSKLQAALNVNVKETGMRSYAYDEQVIKAEQQASEAGKNDYGILPVATALKKTGSDAEPVASEESQTMIDKQQEELRQLLELSPVFSKNAGNGVISEEEDPWIVPLVYGARHLLSEADDLNAAKQNNSGNTSLLSELNLDFRNRIAAGLGASIVQNNQEEFVNRAWEQVEDVNRLNRIIRELNQIDKINTASESRLSTRVSQRTELNKRHRGLTTDAAVRLLSNSAIYGNSTKIDVNDVVSGLPSESAGVKKMAATKKRLAQQSRATKTASNIDQQIATPIMESPFNERSQGIELETLTDLYNFINDCGSEKTDPDFDFVSALAGDNASDIITGLKNGLTSPEPIEQKDTDHSETADDKAEAVSYATEQGRIKVEKILNAYMQSDYNAANLESLLNAKNPVMAYPVFPEPTFFYLRELSTRYILPSVDSLSQNTISAFMSNPKFEEAFLCGMNTEMGQELLWREYPTDERGSYFRKFWDQQMLPDTFDDKYYDIKPVSEWTDNLGRNHTNTKGSLYVFAIRGKLMRSFPETRVDLAIYTKDKGFKLQNKLEMTAWLSDDIYICGFKLDDINDLLAKHPDDLCLVFEEEAQSMRFCINHENAREGNGAVYATSRIRENSIWGCPLKYIFKTL